MQHLVLSLGVIAWTLMSTRGRVLAPSQDSDGTDNE